MRALTWYTRPTVPVKYSNGHWGCVDGTSISQTVFKNPVEELYQGKKMIILIISMGMFCRSGYLERFEISFQSCL